MDILETKMSVLEICRKVVDCEQIINSCKEEKEELEFRLETVNNLIETNQEELRELLSILSNGVYTDIDNIDDNSIL